MFGRKALLRRIEHLEQNQYRLRTIVSEMEEEELMFKQHILKSYLKSVIKDVLNDKYKVEKVSGIKLGVEYENVSRTSWHFVLVPKYNQSADNSIYCAVVDTKIKVSTVATHRTDLNRIQSVVTLLNETGSLQAINFLFTKDTLNEKFLTLMKKKITK